MPARDDETGRTTGTTSAIDARTAQRRAALEAVAYGPGVPPDRARAARLELEALRTSSASLAVHATPPRSETPPGPAAASAPRPATLPGPDAAASREAGPARAATPPDAPAHRSEVDPSTGERDEDPAPRDRGPWVRRWTGLPVRLRTVGLLAIAGTAVASFAVGAVVGTTADREASRPATVARSAGDGPTLAALLSAPQTFADQLPGALSAPVRLHSTRLVFTNRSLSADDAQTPWDVYAGVGTDSSLVCLLATADGRTASTSCFPRADALSGSVALVAQTESGTITVHVRGGVVSGRVTPAS